MSSKILKKEMKMKRYRKKMEKNKPAKKGNQSRKKVFQGEKETKKMKFDVKTISQPINVLPGRM